MLDVIPNEQQAIVQVNKGHQIFTLDGWTDEPKINVMVPESSSLSENNDEGIFFQRSFPRASLQGIMEASSFTASHFIHLPDSPHLSSLFNNYNLFFFPFPLC